MFVGYFKHSTILKHLSYINFTKPNMPCYLKKGSFLDQNLSTPHPSLYKKGPVSRPLTQSDYETKAH